MKRGRPLERRSELRADVEKVRAFLQRGRGGLGRNAPLKPGHGFRRASAAEGPLTPAQWRQAVHDASGGRCLMTGARARDVDDRRFDPHHPLAKSILRDRGLLTYVWDARNGIWLHRNAHANHELGARRVPAELLPSSVWEFCAELDELAGSQWATYSVLRTHPAAGSSRVLSRGEHDGEG